MRQSGEKDCHDMLRNDEDTYKHHHDQGSGQVRGGGGPSGYKVVLGSCDNISEIALTYQDQKRMITQVQTYLVVLLLCQALDAGHEDVVVSQEAVQDES